MKYATLFLGLLFGLGFVHFHGSAVPEAGYKSDGGTIVVAQANVCKIKPRLCRSKR